MQAYSLKVVGHFLLKIWSIIRYPCRAFEESLAELEFMNHNDQKKAISIWSMKNNTLYCSISYMLYKIENG